MSVTVIQLDNSFVMQDQCQSHLIVLKRHITVMYLTSRVANIHATQDKFTWSSWIDMRVHWVPLFSSALLQLS
eukprot:989041-Pelagomonas_calceolata.AAC.1